jgi:hypothetical protein
MQWVVHDEVDALSLRKASCSRQQLTQHLDNIAHSLPCWRLCGLLLLLVVQLAAGCSPRQLLLLLLLHA